MALGLALLGIAVGLGGGSLILNNRLAYETLRWAGALYLCWLAYDSWREGRRPIEAAPVSQSHFLHFRRGFVTNLLNPKAAVFYIAVLPEFVQIGRGAIAAQTLMLSAIYVAVATTIHLSIVLLAARLQTAIETPDSRRTIRRVLAMLLAVIAIWFAVSTERN